MSGRLITHSELANLTTENTNAHRLWTGSEGWIDRFGNDYLVSTVQESVSIADRLFQCLRQLDLTANRIFLRQLVKQPGKDSKSQQIWGAEDSKETTVFERGLKFSVNFDAGYSVGLFCDQRANRAHLESLQPQRMLNCFAYTCAFSVAAARAGAKTLNIDLSRKSLDRGKTNLALNSFDPDNHVFIVDDLFSALPRLARRGEIFDTIILDPPTFSRGKKGRIFRAESDLDCLLKLALTVAERGAWILLSTNARELEIDNLRQITRGLTCKIIPPPSEYPPGYAATTLWLAAP